MAAAWTLAVPPTRCYSAVQPGHYERQDQLLCDFLADPSTNLCADDECGRSKQQLNTFIIIVIISIIIIIIIFKPTSTKPQAVILG